MKKKTIDLVILLLLNIIFIGTAQADNCNLDTEYQSQLVNVLNSQFTASYGSTAYTQNFNSPLQFNEDDMDYVKFYLHYEIRQNTGTISNWNMGLTCSRITQPLEGYNADYTITYQDGSTANISGQELNTICAEYVTNDGNGTYKYQPNINTVHLVIIRDDDKYIPCDVDSNGNAICPIKGNHSYKAFRYYINLSEGENVPVSIGIITRLVPKCKRSEREIVDKQNETNNKIDEIKNSDISNDNKEAPNTNEFNDYQKAENGLFDKMKQADTNNLDVAIDGNSANFVWDTITRFYNSNALLMNFLISILSIGIIKMALGR